MSRVLLDIKASCPMLGDLLDKRYQIVQVLSSGAFGRTYIAEDTFLPSLSKRIIRHLKPLENDPDLLPFIEQVFRNQTKIFASLGHHSQIPELFDFFADDQGVYLVQEFIPGELLSNLVPHHQRSGKCWAENQVIQLLKEVLVILDFIHSQGIIHCDIKPNNLTKSFLDGQICLLDLGAFQPISERSNVKFNLPPAGYVPAEQLAYQPHPNSDIYALGMIAIQALTGIHPTQLKIDSLTGEISWQHLAYVSDELAAILNQMIRYHYQDRYQTATEVLLALDNLTIPETSQIIPQELLLAASPVQDLENLLDFPETSSEATDNLLKKPKNKIALISVPINYLLFQITHVSPLFLTFLIGITCNSLVLASALFYISQPDPKQFKEVEKFVGQLPLENWSDRVCEIPAICFWLKNK